MSDTLEIHTLGGLTIQRNGIRLTRFETRKMEALLVYLAYTGQGQSREFLGELLWQDRTQEQSLSNLRLLLHRLRSSVQLTTTRRTVSLAEPCKVDAVELTTHLTAIEQQVAQQGALSSQTIAGWENALARYQGDFLSGFYIADARGFDEWVYFEREQINLRVLKMTEYLIQIYLSQGAILDGIRQAQRLLQLDPLREVTHHLLIQLYAKAGQSGKAIAQYRTYADMLDEELGMLPSTELQVLYQTIVQVPDQPSAPQSINQAGTLQQLPSLRPSIPKQRNNLPIPTTPFVGREKEIAKLCDLLKTSARLITISGPGGMGKSRLALEIAHSNLDAYSDGVFIVELSHLTEPASIIPTLATTIGYRFEADRDQQGQLQGYLQNKNMLLVMDNYEHLISAATLVSDLLESSPGLKCLVTSRQALNLSGEHIFVLNGMEIPLKERKYDVLDCASAELFIQSARRASTDFVLRSEDYDALLDICNRVEGVPLALILAGAWVDTLTIQEIAQEIAASFDFLDREIVNIPTRQRSMRAVFNYSWNLLSQLERDTLSQMSIFRDGCTRKSAQTITGASLSVLTMLLNKSLLHRNLQTGRFEVHELIRQFGEEQLEANGTADHVRRAHSQYYLEELERLLPDLMGGDQIGALKSIEADFENYRTAWQYAVLLKDIARLDAALESLMIFAVIRNRGAEVQDLYRLALPVFTCSPLDKRWIHLVAVQHMLAAAVSGIPPALDKLNNAVNEAKEGEDERTKALCIFALGLSTLLQSKFTEALPTVQEAYDLFVKLNMSFYQTWALLRLSFAYRNLRHDKQAVECASQGLELALRTGTKFVAAGLYHQHGTIALSANNFDQARVDFREAIAIRTELGYLSGVAWSLGVLCALEIMAGNPDQARAFATQALELAHVLNSRLDEGLANSGLAWIDAVQGNFNFALDLAKRMELLVQINPDALGINRLAQAFAYAALDQDRAAAAVLKDTMLGIGLRYPGLGLSLLIPTAKIFAEHHQSEYAIQLMSLAFHHPQSLRSWLDNDILTQNVLTKLRNRLDSMAFDVAWQKGSSLELIPTIQEVLANPIFTPL